MLHERMYLEEGQRVGGSVLDTIYGCPADPTEAWTTTTTWGRGRIILSLYFPTLNPFQLVCRLVLGTETLRPHSTMFLFLAH
jgi:hypothetical protein